MMLHAVPSDDAPLPALNQSNPKASAVEASRRYLRSQWRPKTPETIAEWARNIGEYERREARMSSIAFAALVACSVWVGQNAWNTYVLAACVLVGVAAAGWLVRSLVGAIRSLDAWQSLVAGRDTYRALPPENVRRIAEQIADCPHAAATLSRWITTPGIIIRTEDTWQLHKAADEWRAYVEYETALAVTRSATQ